MVNNSMPSRHRDWQKNSIIAEQFANLLADYQARKSKFIKYVPTEKELREAAKFYKKILDLSEKDDPDAKQLLEILNSVSTIPEEQIKFTGFMDELFKKIYLDKTTTVKSEYLMNLAEKWDVLDYIFYDRLRALGINLDVELKG